ncbi:GntR family transcriptional regulator [Crossiella sp. CA-258035]|uniref:GntR family transcriptional regulator n=1 Tax=Crossiella sp. CA-258035 TaxID=2981138 RepID=UPI0024BC641F|nr:GntR family transcriptional regulator [Crossiella sp. CA-258035]WHT19805.1 GntR family transcriptional regulator [Crossiella sp. CA-258035]
MLDLGTVNRSDDRSPYRQIADLLREQIKLGRIPASEKLPSESALIEHFGVARMTVRQAIQELRSEAWSSRNMARVFSRGRLRPCGGWLRIGSPGSTGSKESRRSSWRPKPRPTQSVLIRSA